MAVIKLLKQGFENYTGVIGTFQFNDGVSEEMSRADADRMSASITCGLVTDNGVESLSPLNKAMKLRSVEMKTPALSDEVKKESTEEKSQEPIPFDFDETSLDELIEKKGIKGLRELADRYDVRGTQIFQIRNDLLAKKAAYGVH